MPSKAKDLSLARTEGDPDLNVTHEDLISFMQGVLAEHRPAQGDDPGLTREEWANEWHVSDNMAYNRLRELHHAGLLVAGRRMIIAMDGARRCVPVYRAKVE
jgi:hypothetical protein